MIAPLSVARSYVSRSLCALTLTLVAAACGDDIGECDQSLAKALVYSSDGMVATKGQALMHDSCGNGAACHSALATGDQRHGAPDGMDFDLLPFPTGWSTVIQHRDEVWNQVRDGLMPPSDFDSGVYGDRDWLFDAQRNPDAPKLQALDTSEGKGALRNWLACGAPLVSDSQVPEWAQAACTTSGDSQFDELYEAVLKPNCVSCHNRSAAGRLNMVDACTAYQQLQDSGDCGVRLRPGDLSSPLLDQVSDSPKCGSPMPPNVKLSADAITKLRDYIKPEATDSN